MKNAVQKNRDYKTKLQALKFYNVYSRTIEQRENYCNIPYRESLKNAESYHCTMDRWILNKKCVYDTKRHVNTQALLIINTFVL